MRDPSTDKHRKKILFQSYLSYQAERYNELYENIKQNMKYDKISKKELYYLLCSIKSMIGQKKSSLRNLKRYFEEDEQKQKWKEKYQNMIKKEMNELYDQVLHLIVSNLIPKVANEFQMVELLTTKADLLKLKSEVVDCKEEKIKNIQESLEVFELASKKSENFSPVNIEKVKLAQSFSIFLSYYVKDMPRAIEVARNCFDNVIINLEDLDYDSYKNVTLEMSLMR